MNKLSLQRNFAFIFILILGIIYSVFLSIAFEKIFAGFFMQPIFLIDTFKNHHENIFKLIFSYSFFVNLFSGIVLFYLLGRLIKALFSSSIKLFKTKKFINKLSTEKSNIPFAFTFGFLSPKIFISPKLNEKLSTEEFNAVLLHEQKHQKNYDPLKDFIVDLVKNILPEFPKKSWLFGNYSALVEIVCDQYSEKYLKSKTPLISALLKINNNQNVTNFCINNFSSQSERIKILTEQKQPVYRTFFAFNSILLSIFLLGSLTLSQSNLFYKCSHLVQCVEVLLTPKNMSLIDHCKQ